MMAQDWGNREKYHLSDDGDDERDRERERERKRMKQYCFHSFS